VFKLITLLISQITSADGTSNGLLVCLPSSPKRCVRRKKYRSSKQPWPRPFRFNVPPNPLHLT